MIRRIAMLLPLFGYFFYATDGVGNSVGHTPGAIRSLFERECAVLHPDMDTPGIRGIQPHLALTYDSQLSYGLMGPGWTITGLSAISRCNPTFAQDGTPAPITLTAADGLCLDGNRLRGDPVGSSVYQTEIANF